MKKKLNTLISGTGDDIIANNMKEIKEQFGEITIGKIKDVSKG